MKTSVYDLLPRKTIVIRWDRGHMRVHLHLAMPRMNKDDAAKLFSTLRKFAHWCPENEALVKEIHEWFYIAVRASYDALKRANTAYQDGFDNPAPHPKRERGKIAERNRELRTAVQTAKHVNDRLEDRLALYEQMFKGWLE